MVIPCLLEFSSFSLFCCFLIFCAVLALPVAFLTQSFKQMLAWRMIALQWLLLCHAVDQLQVHVYPPSLGLPAPPPLSPCRVVTEPSQRPVLFPAGSLFYPGQCVSVRAAPLNSSHPLLPLLCPQVHSLRLHLSFCPADWFISTIFLDSIHMH